MTDQTNPLDHLQNLRADIAAIRYNWLVDIIADRAFYFDETISEAMRETLDEVDAVHANNLRSATKPDLASDKSLLESLDLLELTNLLESLLTISARVKMRSDVFAKYPTLRPW